jgi:Zn-finger nucleic acid-binding protein
MASKIYCPVCQITFSHKEPLSADEILICPVCGAKLQVAALAPEIQVEKLPQPPDEEINDRIEEFARLRGYVFSEDKVLIVEGLLQKKETYGDFYCPCRFDNIPENICPCLETRMGQVKKVGHCF